MVARELRNRPIGLHAEPLDVCGGCLNFEAIEDDVHELRVADSGVSAVGCVVRRLQPATEEAKDSRLGRRAGLCPGPAVT